MKNLIIEDIDFKKGSGLVPVIVQDEQSMKVLMMAYMNKEALEKTRESGLATFYSRSRQSIWVKGETSGNFLKVRNILMDCDADTILLIVNPDGPACHTGADTCFGEENNSDIIFLDYLQKLIKTRKDEMPEGSYTTKLFEKGINRIAQKVGEEAVETVISSLNKDDEDFLNEGADLIYHLLVLLTEKGYEINDLARVLKSRH